jgi:CheY-like chemotaxis protein/Tfp pilus assembly protein PilF
MSARLLCVQRDRDVGQRYAAALEDEGHEVICAGDGRSAFEAIRRQPPSLIVLDTQLPRQDGFEILAEIRARPGSACIPVLLLHHGDLTQDVRDRAAKLDAVGIESAPMPRKDLVARVAALLAGGGPARPSASVPDQGSLRAIPFPDLLRRLHVDALDGVVLLDHGKKKKAIELRQGWPASVKSNLVSECFGSYLVQQGRCTKAQLEESIARMKTGEGLQGEILVAMDVLDERGVAEALQEHALEKFFEIFSWRDGRFTLRRGTQVQRGSSFHIEGHPSRLIVEGIRRRYPLKVIDRFLEHHRAEQFVPRVAESDDLEAMGLATKEIRWLRKLDGPRPVAALLEASEATRRFAFGLITIELLQIQTRSGEAIELNAPIEPMAADPIAPPPPTTSQSDDALRSELAALANQIRDQDHYGVLGVSPISNDEEIAEAYAALSKRVHPDRFHGSSSSVRQLAAQVFERISEAHSGIATAEDRTQYAQAQSRGKRDAAAQDEGRRALQAETEFQKGEKLLAMREYEKALQCFGRAMEYFPREGEYRSHYGWCLYLCHPDNDVMLQEALEHCRNGLKLAKDREKPYLLLGRLYKAMGRPGAAKKMFARAVEIKPQCVEAMRELRIMNMRREKDKGVLKRIFRR